MTRERAPKPTQDCMKAEIWKILVVGSDCLFQNELLDSAHPISCREAPSGAAALELVAGFDCLILKPPLGDMEVLELLGALRVDDLPRCPVVVIAGPPDGPRAGDLLRAGAMEHLNPNWLSGETLIHAVESAIERHAWLIERHAWLIERHAWLIERHAWPGECQNPAGADCAEELLESVSTLRSFYESSQFLMGVVELPADDSEIIHIYDNPATHAFLGVPAGGDVSGTSKEHSKTVRDLWIRHYRESQRSATPVRFENRHPAPEGPNWLSSVVAYIGQSSSGQSRFSYITDDITQRKEIEAQQREGANHLALTLQAGQLGFWDWNIVTGHAYYGGSWEKMLGYAPGELEPHVRVWKRLIHPDDQGRITRILTDHLEGRTEYYAAEHRLRHKDGSWRWILTRGQVVERDAAGTALRAVGTHADITERKQAEERLRESEERFRLLVESSSQAVWETDPDGLAAIDAPSWRAFTGQTLEQWADDGWAAVVHPEDRQGAFDKWSAHVAGEPGVYQDQFRFRRHDGQWRWTRVVAAPLPDASGKLMKWVGMNIDITEQKEAEGRLRESESFYRQILESIPGMTFTCTPEGDCDYISQQWIEFTGVPMELQLGSGWMNLLHPDDVARTADAWRAAVENRGTYDLEYRVRSRAGTYEWFKVRSRAIRDSSGKIVRWFGAAVNVDDLVRAEEALRQADQRKDEFLAMLAHELRNPLAPILNAVEILRLTTPAQPGLEGIHEVIERQVRHLVHLVDDLLDVSRVSSGKIQLRTAPLDLIEVVQQAIEMHRPVIAARQHQFTHELPAHPVRLTGDAVRLAQVIGNLLNNAAKYSDPGGHIHLSLTVEDHPTSPCAVLRVRDRGRGIEPAALHRLFDLFYQADRTIDRSEGGLGLGLSLVKSLAQMHGGSVEAHSAGRGHGSEFIVRLPILPRPALAALPPSSSPLASDTPCLRVLVVDDNRDSAESMTLLLRLKGHEVHTAHDGQQAVELALHCHPHVVLLDIGLPKLNGYEACRAMRQAGLTTSLIVAMTGYGQSHDRQLSQQADFDAHLVKPVALATIVDLLERRQRKIPKTTADQQSPPLSSPPTWNVES